MARYGRWTLGRRLLLGLGLALAVTTARAEPSKAARLVGADAVFYAEITKPADVVERVSNERVQTLLASSPAYKRRLDAPEFQQFRQVVEFVSKDLGTTWDKGLRDLTGAGMVLAVEGKQKPERIFLIVTPSDPDFLTKAHARLLELARKDASDKGKPDPVKEAEHRGIKAYSVTPTEAHAIVDGRLIITNGSDTLKTVIDRSAGANGGSSIVENADWKACQDKLGPDTIAWAFARLDRLREMDPKRFKVPETVNPGATIFFGSWVEALRKAPWVSASVTWTDGRLGAQVTLPTPPGGYANATRRFLPPDRAGAPAVLNPPNAIASLSLWRDLSALWEVRAELLPPEAQQGLAQLDTTAGTFFGGRDFGTGVLGSLSSDWRLIVARQDTSTFNPKPDLKLPAFALILSLKPDDEEFATRLKAAFQSFIGLTNLDAAKEKAPPLMLGSETFEGVTIATSKYLPPKDPKAKEGPVHQRHNFTPSAAQVDQTFIISSSLGLTKDLIKALKSPGKPSEATVLLDADGVELAKILDENKARLVAQNMLEQGNDKAKAEEEVGFLARLVRYLGHARASVQDRPETLQFRLDFQLGEDR